MTVIGVVLSGIGVALALWGMFAFVVVVCVEGVDVRVALDDAAFGLEGREGERASLLWESHILHKGEHAVGDAADGLVRGLEGGGEFYFLCPEPFHIRLSLGYDIAEAHAGAGIDLVGDGDRLLLIKLLFGCYAAYKEVTLRDGFGGANVVVVVVLCCGAWCALAAVGTLRRHCYGRSRRMKCLSADFHRGPRKGKFSGMSGLQNVGVSNARRGT